MYEFTRTGQLLPILIGTTMQDPAGTEMEVTILGVDKDRSSGRLRPLAGTMEDPEGRGEKTNNAKVEVDLLFCEMKRNTSKAI